MGGTILKHADWQWHVLALCRAGDPDREQRFHRSARALGTRERISDLDDSPVLAPLSEDLREIKNRIRLLGSVGWDLIFTHGPNGEYTYHQRHVEVHRAVAEMVAADQLTGDLAAFAYEDGFGAYRARPAADADITVELTPDEFTRKRGIVRDIYDFHRGSIEFDCAGPVEAFDVADPDALPRVRMLLEPVSGDNLANSNAI